MHASLIPSFNEIQKGHVKKVAEAIWNDPLTTRKPNTLEQL